MTFTVGINLPWVDGQYDHDFGYNVTRKPDIDYEPNPTFSKDNFERYIKVFKNKDKGGSFMAL